MKYNPNVTYFARTDFRSERKIFGIKQLDRAYHTYILGKTGTGKTNLLITKILQDIKYDRGVCIFDVHGDLTTTVLNHIPSYRKKDLVFIDIPNPNHTVGYNPLKKVSPEKRSLVASGVLDTFQKLWSGAWGVRMEHILRMILLTLLEQPNATLSDIPKILLDKEYREQCQKYVSSKAILQFWNQEFNSYTKTDLVPILNKVGAFLVQPAIRRFFIDNKDSISMRKIMDERKILVVNLNKGILGADTAHLVGSLLLNAITLASFSRSNIPEKLRVPFHIFLDEFQNYTTKTLVNLLSEIRKMKVTLTMAHQYYRQLDNDIRDAVIGNVGTIISFRLSSSDASFMVKELYKDTPTFIEIGDYVHLENYRIYLRLMIDGKPCKPFSAVTIPYSEVVASF